MMEEVKLSLIRVPSRNIVKIEVRLLVWRADPGIFAASNFANFTVGSRQVGIKIKMRINSLFSQ